MPPATGSKKLPPPAFPENGRCADCVAVLETVEDDFSAEAFIGDSAVDGSSTILSPVHPQHVFHPRQFDHRKAPGQLIQQNVVGA